MAATWTPYVSGGRSLVSVQALTESAPTLATEGIALDGLGAVVPVLQAPNGQTFTGAGNLRAWLYVGSMAQWIRMPRADDDLLDAAGLAVVAFPSIPINQSGNRLALIADSIGLSGGSQVTLNLIASDRNTSVVTR